MFEGFKINLTKNDEKILIEWINDIYRHLTILLENPRHLNLDNISENLLELGLIKSADEYKAFKFFFAKKFKHIKWEEFLRLIVLNKHDNGYCHIPKLCVKCRNEILQREIISNKPTLVDLFCGSGGMSLGFVKAGFRTIFANDIEPSCIQTYSFNHPEVDRKNIVLGDIQNIAQTVVDYTANEYVDIVIGGPPCQGFSNANQQRIIDDPRNKLYRDYVKVVASVRPSFFVMENVVGMKEIASQIIEDFNKIGYKVEYEVLNAYDFGVPQQRKRIIFIGNKLGVDNKEIFEEIHNANKHIVPKTLFDAIGDLPNLEPLRIKNATNFESDECGWVVAPNTATNSNDYINQINDGNSIPIIYNHKSRYNNDRDIEIFSRLNQGDKSDDPKIADIMPYASRNDIFKDKYYKLVYNQPSKTITAHMKFDCNMYIHSTQARGLTPREAARAQSYPDDYYFKGSFTKTYMQIGNSVPPLMAKTIAAAICKRIKTIPKKQLEDQMILNI